MVRQKVNVQICVNCDCPYSKYQFTIKREATITRSFLVAVMYLGSLGCGFTVWVVAQLTITVILAYPEK